MSIPTMPRNEREARQKIQSSLPSSLERLEPRLLLDADVTDPDLLLSVDVVSGPPALVVDLDQAGRQIPVGAAPAGGESISYDPVPLALSSPAPGTSAVDVAPPSLRADALLAPKGEMAAASVSSPPAGQGPYGATFEDTTEFMIGDVWVTLVLLESDGSIDASTEDWTTTEISEVEAEIQEGLAWWQDPCTLPCRRP